MSDYISKDSLKNDIIANLPQGRIKAVYLELVDSQPTLDEKEIIRKPFERVVERLKEKRSEFRQARHGLSLAMYTDEKAYAKARILTQKELVVNEAIEIVKEECGINE